MNYGKIPTWEECSEKADLDEILPEGRGLLDPIERLIYDNEPCGLDAQKDFRDQVQEVVNFLSANA